jgi:hypothetical protein
MNSLNNEINDAKELSDLQIYEGNFEKVPTITPSEIRIFLSSTFKGNIISDIKVIKICINLITKTNKRLSNRKKLFD